LYDSAGNDSLTATPASITLVGAGFSSAASGFSEVLVHATAGGYDKAVFYDGAGVDRLDVGASYAWQRGSGYSIRAEGVEYIAAVATYGGGDRLNLIGSAGDDSLSLYLNNRNFFSGGVQVYTYNFQYALFDGGGGYDRIDYYAAGKTAALYGRSSYGAIVDSAFETQFSGMEAVLARARSSQKLKTDLAVLDFTFQKLSR
jgi:hypothetical protein